MAHPTSARDSAGSATSGLGIANISLPSKEGPSDSTSSFSDYRSGTYTTQYSNPSPRTRLRRPKSVNELGNSINSRASTRSKSVYGAAAGSYAQLDDVHVDFGNPTMNRGGPSGPSSSTNMPDPKARPDFNRLRSDFAPLSRFSPPTPSVDPSNEHAKNFANQGMGRYQINAGLPWKAGPVLTPILNPRRSQPSSSGHPFPTSRALGPGIAVPMMSGGNTPYIPYMDAPSVLTTGTPIFPPRAEGPRKRALSEGECQLVRQGTLLTPHANSKRASAELGVMLGSSNQKANKRKLLPQGELPIEEKLAKLDQVKLEAKRGKRARVEVDVILESEVFVEGGELRGRLEVRIRRGRKGESLWIGGGKVRVCGYEEHAHTSTRHIFYHYPHQLPLFAPENDSYHPIFASAPNEDGYRMAREGLHIIPFSVRLPMGGGAKGGWSGSMASGVRYVVVGSIKLHTPETKKRAIAHFYRPCTIYPYVEPSFAFSNQVGGAEVHTEQGLGWSLSGDKGQVGVTIKVPRPHWVAGQQVWLDITVNNKSSRKIKTMTLALLSTVILFTPPASNGQSSTMSPDLAKYPGRSTRKKLFEQTTEASGGSGSGYVGSRGWWTGVQPGECIRWQSSLTLPAECLTIIRSRLIDVSYAIRLTLNGSIHLDIPISILNFMSIDPPPTCAFSAGVQKSYALPIEHEMPTEQEMTPYHDQRQMQAYGQVPSRAMEVGDVFDSRSRYSNDFQDRSQAPPSFPLGQPLPMPETPATRRRPLSMESGMQSHSGGKVSFAPAHSSLSGQPGSSKSRPNSMYSMGRPNGTPILRPGTSRRDTTMSYLSAVASVEENDLVTIEARRRAGRQASLAAILLGQDLDEEEVMVDEEVNVTPSSGTFAPQTMTNSVEGSPNDNVDDRELTEAQRDLDFIKATLTPEIDPNYNFGSPAAVSMNPSSRDSASRFLEEDLHDQHVYESRFDREPSDPLGEKVQAGRSPVQTGVTPSAMSHSVYDDDEEDDGNDEGLHRSTSLSQRSLELHNQAQVPPLPHFGMDQARLAQIGATRSMYGSFAASAHSVASGNESEVGQVVEAIRRNLSMRNPSSHDEAAEEEGTNVAALPDKLPNLRRFLDVPRSNSLGPPLGYPIMPARRPSAPASSFRRPSNWSGISPSQLDSQSESETWLNTPNRRPSAPNSSAYLPISRSLSPLAKDNSATGTSPAGTVRNPSLHERQPRNDRKYSHSSGLEAVVDRLSRLATPLEGPPEPTPGLAPSAASDSASSQSHGDERSVTPTQERPKPERDSSGPMTPCHETAREGIEVRIWRESSSSAATTNPRNSLRSPKRLRVPSGPRDKPRTSPQSSYKSRYGSSVESNLPQDLKMLTVTIPEVPNASTYDRSSEKSPMGSMRFMNSPVDMSPRSASRYQDYGLVERLSHSPAKGGSSAVNSMRTSPMQLSTRQLERQSSQASMRSTSTTATQLETMLLERKGSSYVFEHSKYMQDWTGHHKSGPYRKPGMIGDDEETESISLL